MISKHVILAGILLFTGACTMPRRSVESVDQIPNSQVILVGRLSINKNLPPSTNVIDTMDITASGLIRASAAPLPFLETKPSGFEKNDLLVKWDELFSVPFEHYSDIFVNGIYAFRYDRKGPETFSFPVMGSIHVPIDARYLYVGHISLKLDDFYNLESLRVIDEFKKDAKRLARFPGIHKSLFKISNTSI
jgi:hypothetical protein